MSLSGIYNVIYIPEIFVTLLLAALKGYAQCLMHFEPFKTSNRAGEADAQ